MITSVTDTYRQSVEAVSGGKNTVIYDDKGNPSVMVMIPKFKLSDIDASWPNEVHPAFLVEGREVSEIYIAKYQAIVKDGRALSLPGVDPTAYINFDTAKAACDSKGPGWHIMNNTEWAAIALWCKRNGYMPRGNTNYGCDHSASYERGRMMGDSRTATGSGPASWYHDGTPFGIADLNGNVWEWNDGMKLVDGRIYVHGQDGKAMNNYMTKNEHRSVVGWMDTGAYYDCDAAGRADGNRAGNALLNNKRVNPMYTTDPSTDAYQAYSDQAFESLKIATGYTPPTVLQYLALQPAGTGYEGDYLWVRNYEF